MYVCVYMYVCANICLNQQNVLHALFMNTDDTFASELLEEMFGYDHKIK